MRPSKILITGNAGAGKSTLAHELGNLLSLPVIAALVKQSTWIIDGVSPLIETHADLVVFLDTSRAQSTWRCAKRNWRYLFWSRPGLPANCPELLIVPQLLKIIWGFDTHVRPRLVAALRDPLRAPKYRHVRTWPDRIELLDELCRRP